MSVKLGATGDYPAGKTAPDDEGGLMVAVSLTRDRVRVDFGPKPIAWVSLRPEEAIAFGTTLIDKAMGLKFQGAKAMREAAGETKQ